jgi:excisionase family DNA binding protein
MNCVEVLPESRYGRSRVMGDRERVKVEGAMLILGVERRTVQKMAQRGELPGAALMGRLWTFDKEKLHGYVRNKESERWHGQRHRLDVSGKVISSTVGSRSKEKSSSGRFAQAIQNLRHNAEQRAKSAR